MVSDKFDPKYFTWEDVVDSQVAIRNGIHNDPPDSLFSEICRAANCLDDVREYLDNPVLVSSWYRCLELNRAIGSKDTSDHPHGTSIDFTCPKYGTPQEVFEAIKASHIQYDQLIMECGRWVHISFNKKNRRQNLTFNGRTYVEVK